jgi:bifunctional non-homologous end joining protein LigD
VDASFIPPMMPTLVDEPPEGDCWLHEIKYDGYRTIVAVDGENTKAFTRNGHDWSAKYAPIVEEAASLKCRTAILDGEMVVQDENGVSDFAELRSAIRWSPQRLILYAFDLLMIDGMDLRRKAPHRAPAASPEPRRRQPSKPHPFLDQRHRQRR